VTAHADMVRLPLERPDLFVAVDIAVTFSFNFHAQAAVAAAEEQADFFGLGLQDFFGADMACIGCGCTEEAACPGGCSWASTDPPVCSACKA
jgi:hypothetical protein